VTLLLTRLAEITGVEVPLRHFFDQPTAAGAVAGLLAAWPGDPDLLEHRAALALEIAALGDDEVDELMSGSADA
jgi:hypothetical protein